MKTMKTELEIAAKSVSSSRGRTVVFWVVTSMLALVLVSGGLAQLLHRPENVEGMRHLGYPVYVSTILGFWKILGGIAILIPGFPRVKEWAYAGIFFELTGASASQAACGDGFAHVIWPSSLLRWLSCRGVSGPQPIGRKLLLPISQVAGFPWSR